jgi:hypothetical protein
MQRYNPAMSVPETNVGTYLKSFFGDWFTLLCGQLSVPFTAIAVWWARAPSARVLWACLAVIAFFVASYRVWRKERISGSQALAELQKRSSFEVSALKEQISTLTRKPYDEELGRQGAALIARLSPEGKNVLRNLVAQEPIEIGRHYIPQVAQDIQDQQISLAFGSGIVRHDIVRTGNGNIIRQDYVINPQFRTVLRDLLYDR